MSTSETRVCHVMPVDSISTEFFSFHVCVDVWGPFPAKAWEEFCLVLVGFASSGFLRLSFSCTSVFVWQSFCSFWDTVSAQLMDVCSASVTVQSVDDSSSEWHQWEAASPRAQIIDSSSKTCCHVNRILNSGQALESNLELVMCWGWRPYYTADWIV